MPPITTASEAQGVIDRADSMLDSLLVARDVPAPDRLAIRDEFRAHLAIELGVVSPS